jgi:hypothetical protein
MSLLTVFEMDSRNYSRSKFECVDLSVTPKELHLIAQRCEHSELRWVEIRSLGEPRTGFRHLKMPRWHNPVRRWNS